MPSPIDTYKEICALSTQMVEAARANDWERLVDLERNVAALRDSLIGENDSTSPSPQELDLKRGLIQRILDDDAEIRRHTEPWMEQVRRFLGGRSTRERVDRTYGSSS
ncbi:MAG: flagellar protein FliT [Georgfuchsia sp.]